MIGTQPPRSVYFLLANLPELDQGFRFDATDSRRVYGRGRLGLFGGFQHDTSKQHLLAASCLFATFGETYRRHEETHRQQPYQETTIAGMKE